MPNDTAPPPSPTATPSPAAATNPAASPAGAPVANCDAPLPPGTNAPLSDISTLFSVRITPDGMMHDLTIYKSSGNTLLDDTLIACASGHRAEPAMIDGRPTEATLILAHHWSASEPLSRYEIAMVDKPRCTMRDYPGDSSQISSAAPIALTYRVATDGTVKDISLDQSTGVAWLDKDTEKCMSGLKFYPVTHDGQPIEVQRSFSMQWQYHH